jgi:predicted acyltransferase
MYLVEVGRPADDAYKNMVEAAYCAETLGQAVYMFFFSMA